MTAAGFSADLKILSVEPPKNAYSMRVGVHTKGFGHTQGLVGAVNAYAYMNKETQDYEESLGTGSRLSKPNNHEKIELMKQQPGESFQDAFRKSATCFTSIASDKSVKKSNLDERQIYLNKILENRGFFKRILLALFGSPVITGVLAGQLKAVTEIENQANARIEKLKIAIAPAVDTKLDNSSKLTGSWQRWRRFQLLLDDPTNADKHTRLMKDETHYCKDKPTSTLGESTYQSAFNELNACHDELIQVNKDKNKIRVSILTIINDCSTKTNTDPAKHAVMTAIKNYVTAPSDTMWTALEKATTPPANEGWDKGLLSQVSQLHEEVATLKIQNKI